MRFFCAERGRTPGGDPLVAGFGFLRPVIASKVALVALLSAILAARLACTQTLSKPSAGELPPQAKPIAEVVVPIPSEVFGSLDKFSNSNWRLVQIDGLAHTKPHGDETQIALLLGVTIGEGFIAVEAHDAAEVKEVGAAVLRLAQALGVQPTVMRRSRSIVELADKNDWPAVRKEWDAVLPEVQEGMKQLKSEQLSQLVSVGGWLRGTRALTALILQHYSAKDAELLRQPALLDRFEKQLGDMRPNPKVLKMQEGLRQMKSLVASSRDPISGRSVRDLSVICDDLLATITGSAPKR